MIVPDCIAPIVAQRIWRWDTGGLTSLNGELWVPGKPLVAACNRVFCPGTWSSRTQGAGGASHAPAIGGTCGVYAAKDLNHLHKSGYTKYGIHGEVYLWGFVVEHEMGWRAQYAYPRNLVLDIELMPSSMANLEARMAKLTAYGCDISVVEKERVVPLWSKVSAYQASSLSLLNEQCERWYLSRREERSIKKGDRLAVLGRGIAVLEQVDGDWVHALLWNRSMLRIGRKDIRWDAGNRRWEANRTSSFETSAGIVVGQDLGGSEGHGLHRQQRRKDWVTNGFDLE